MNQDPDQDQDDNEPTINRRDILAALGAVGVGTTIFQRALAAQVEATGTVSAEMIKQAEWIAGLELADEDREATASAVQRALGQFLVLQQVEVGYDVPPALLFDPLPARRPEAQPRGEVTLKERAAERPASDEDLAFLPVTELAGLIRSRQVSSVELTKLYLDRLHRYNETLHCVVSFTDDLALRQAKQADDELARGRYRGPLHGVPWGAKDLIAYPGYTTTWGAPQFKEQRIEERATVAKRLDEAGAVLVAKLTLGALAWGDKWFGGMTRNPWNIEQGSSGSSAGSASAAAAGLVGFTIGSETLGSIVSPSRRCGCSGLRPTFGRVSRYGCMPLAWSMDKLGPICRSIADCAIVFGAIHGYDGLDPTARDATFNWPLRRDVRTLKVGYTEDDGNVEQRDELRVLREIGVQLVPIKLPHHLPASAMTIILNTEASTVFDELVKSGNTDGLNRWPTAFRQGQFVPAVEYLRANRVRSLLIREMQEAVSGVDAYVGGNDLVITNLTGHPTAVLPNGFRDANGVRVPTALTFTGRLDGETELLAVADAYQRATRHHLERPPLDQPA